MVCLNHLYPKLVPGGVIVIDDYLTWTGCRNAVDEYRLKHGIEDRMETTDPLGEVWWRKSE